MEYVVLISI